SCRRQWMAPTRLLVARQKRLLIRLEEKDPVGYPTQAKVVEDRVETLEVASTANIRDHRSARDLGALVPEQLDQRPNHLGGQVVDAEVALVLERRHRGRLSGTREPGDDHQILECRPGGSGGLRGGFELVLGGGRGRRRLHSTQLDGCV